MPKTQVEDVDLTSQDFKRISLMVEKALLTGIERAAAQNGMSTSAFIRQACYRALEQMPNEPDWETLIESTRGLFYYDLNILKKRLEQTGYVSPEGWAVIKKKITDKVGPAENMMGLPSPYHQLLRLLGLNPKAVREEIKKGRMTNLKGGE